MSRDTVISVRRHTHMRRAEREVSSVDGPTTRLVVAAQNGSKEAFEELVRDLGPLIYRFLVVRLRNEADASDALQDTLMVAWQKLPLLRDPRSCRAWLMTIAVRNAAEVVRGHRRHRMAFDGPSPVPDSAETMELDAAIGSLPAEKRDVVLLRYLVGLSEAETAAVLGVSVGTVKSRASRARQELARFMAHQEESDSGGESR